MTMNTDLLTSPTIAQDSCALFKADRAQGSGSPSHRGGALGVYMNHAWCSGAVKVEGRRSPDVKFLMLTCRPFYLPKKFISVDIVAVDVPTEVNSKNALLELYDVININMSLLCSSGNELNQLAMVSLSPSYSLARRVVC